MKFNKKIIIAIFCIASCFIICGISTFAWFYYKKNEVSINTESLMDIETNLYKLENYQQENPKSLELYSDNLGTLSLDTTWTNNGTYYYLEDEEYKIRTPINLGLYIYDSSNYTYALAKAAIWQNINYYSYDSVGSFKAVEEENGELLVETDVSFFQWGDEYITETTDATYYALECILNSNLYSSGRFKAVLSAEMEISTDFNFDSDEDEVLDSYLKFPIVKLSYAIADTPNVVINSNDCASAVTSKEYTELDFLLNDDEEFTEEKSYDQEETYNLNSSIDKNYVNEDQSKFINSDGYIRIIFFIKAEADTEAVNKYMQAYGDLNIGFADVLTITIYNNIELTGAIRSIPMKESE